MAKWIAMSFLSFLVLAGCNRSDKPSDTPQVSSDVMRTDTSDKEVAYCINAGVCFPANGVPCCTFATRPDSRCNTPHHQRCCRPTGAGCCVNCSQCCFGSCNPSTLKCP
jgi:hypothetical protein